MEWLYMLASDRKLIDFFDFGLVQSEDAGKGSCAGIGAFYGHICKVGIVDIQLCHAGWHADFLKVGFAAVDALF